ncbi:PREDICTED: uncharacterized protein LOC109338245 [Lupinus angustifolius]|uniref:uncharacterized protein LOC109338245 n=1 Tax=Lupinus angustifolius TaxID=3871 RepID=UPI00092FD352|nr:PREDICTED: uncharacterized protein LOC109338245 [Lupinus angustifolius]
MPTLVNKRRVYEKDIMDQRTYHKNLQSWKNVGPSRHKSNHRPNFRKPYQPPSRHREFNRKNPQQYSNNKPRENPPKCSNYNKLHFGRRCPSKDDVCFNHGQSGHFRYECPRNPKGNKNQFPTRPPTEKPTKCGKAFALRGSKIEKSHDFIQGLKATIMPYEIAVETPMKSLVMTSKACLQCPVVIQGKTFTMDLICLPLSQLDMILRMDSMSENGVSLNCRCQTIGFLENPGECSYKEDCQYMYPIACLFIIAGD